MTQKRRGRHESGTVSGAGDTEAAHETSRVGETKLGRVRSHGRSSMRGQDSFGRRNDHEE